MFHITNSTLFADDAEMFVKSVYTVTLFFDAPLSHHEYQITSLLRSFFECLFTQL